MGTHRYFFASAPWRTDMNKWIARALNPEKTQPPPAPDSGTGEFSMPKPPPNSPEPPKSHPVPEPRRQTARPPQQDRSPHAFLKSPERLDRIRMGLKQALIPSSFLPVPDHQIRFGFRGCRGADAPLALCGDVPDGRHVPPCVCMWRNPASSSFFGLFSQPSLQQVKPILNLTNRWP